MHKSKNSKLVYSFKILKNAIVNSSFENNHVPNIFSTKTQLSILSGCFFFALPKKETKRSRTMHPDFNGPKDSNFKGFKNFAVSGHNNINMWNSISFLDL